MTAPAVADHVDDDVLVELLAELVGQLGDPDARLGSSPLTWKIGAWIIRATSVVEERDELGEVVKPTWLLMTTCTVPPVR